MLLAALYCTIAVLYNSSWTVYSTEHALLGRFVGSSVRQFVCLSGCLSVGPSDESWVVMRTILGHGFYVQ